MKPVTSLLLFVVYGDGVDTETPFWTMVTAYHVFAVGVVRPRLLQVTPGSWSSVFVYGANGHTPVELTTVPQVVRSVPASTTHSAVSPGPSYDA